MAKSKKSNVKEKQENIDDNSIKKNIESEEIKEDVETVSKNEINVDEQEDEVITSETYTCLKEELKEVQEKLEEAEKQVDFFKQEALKHMAELENFKRRKNQEVENFKKYAAENVVMEFLPVIDNFMIASDHASNADQAESEVIKGFVLIEKQLQTTLEKLNVTKIDALNQPFDPDFHQAIGQEKQDDVDSGIVVKNVQSGFKLAGKVIRPSMVIVSE